MRIEAAIGGERGARGTAAGRPPLGGMTNPAEPRAPRGMSVLAGGLAALVLSSLPAAAAEGGAGHGPSEAVFIAQIVALILVGRLLGELMERIGQPAVMGQLLGGLLLGPSVLGAIWPGAEQLLFPKDGAQKSMIDAIAQLGVLLLLLLTGMETDLALVRRVKRAAVSVSVTGVVVPFSCGILLGLSLPDGMLPDQGKRLVTAIFLGTALSISSVKIVAMVVREMDFLRRDIGQVIVASAIIDDTIGWMIIAVTFGLAQSGGIDVPSLLKSVVGTLVFMAASLTVGRRVVARIIRWTNDSFVSEVPVITAILVIMGVMALTTHLIGVHSVLGAFVAGILVGESPILTRHIEAELRGLVTALFAPIFFGLSGLQADLTILSNPGLLGLTLMLIAIASVGKFAGAFAGAKLGGLSRAEGLALATGMNARGSTEVIVATIGLSMGVLSHDLFTMIVAMAVTTTMVMPPTLRWALRRLPMSEEERARLEREKEEESGFLPRLERLLVAVDESPTGRLAARLAGLVAGSRGTPTTILPLSAGSDATPEGAESALRDAEAETRREDAPVDIDVRAQPDVGPEEAVSSEARKGYDLLMLGLEPSFDPASGRFGRKLAGVASAFEGTLGIVVARSAHAAAPGASRFNILVPVNGSEHSRRAAEIALALARATDSPVTALTVARAGASEEPSPSRRADRRLERSILHEVQTLAAHYEVPLRASVRLKGSPQEAILKQARRGNYTLIVLGVGRRGTRDLFFGDTAAGVLEGAEQSVLLVAS